MPRRTRASGPCIECSRYTTNPRAGRCDACYMRQHRGQQRDVACACCSNRDPAVLVRKRVSDQWVTLCGNCNVRMGRRSIPLDALRAESQWNGRERRTRAA